MKINTKSWLAVATLLLAACGGGGSGAGAPGGSTPVPPVDPAPAADPDAPTFRFNGRFGSAQAGVLMAEVADNGVQLLRYAQFTVDLVHRFADPGAQTDVAANCARTGTVKLQFEDRDGNARASAGDRITALLANCGVPVLARRLSGRLQVDIEGTGADANGALQARLSMSGPVRAEAPTGENIGPVVDGSWQGALAVQWDALGASTELRARSAPGTDIRFTAIRDGAESTDSFRSIDLSQLARHDQASAISTLSFLFDLGARGGTLRVTTPVPIRGDLNAFPKQLQIEAALADRMKLRTQRAVEGGGPPGLIAVLVGADGRDSTSAAQVWGSLLWLNQDVRRPVTQAPVSDIGGGFNSQLPWRGSMLVEEIDRLCEQDVQAGVSRFRADALFQRPISNSPPLTQPGAVVKIQFMRALAQSEPDLIFRFADEEVFMNPASTGWHVGATSLRRGASYEVRPLEPLRQYRRYVLQASYDGSNWFGERHVLGADGGLVNSGSETFANIYTDNQLVLDAFGSDTGTVAREAPARLRSSVELRDGQSVRAYQWRQLSGVPLQLATPTAAETDALLAAPVDQAVGDALLELTVTDTLGNSDRVRVAMKVGNVVPQGAAHYTESRSGLRAAHRELQTGMGSIFYGPEAGQVSGRVPGPDEGGTGTNFSVTAPLAERLEVRVYPKAVMAAAPGPLPGLISRVYCDTVGASVSGSFEVLDVAYDAQGRITRLALDYLQRCDAGLQEYQRGSYRLNSRVPLRP